MSEEGSGRFGSRSTLTTCRITNLARYARDLTSLNREMGLVSRTGKEGSLPPPRPTEYENTPSADCNRVCSMSWATEGNAASSSSDAYKEKDPFLYSIRVCRHLPPLYN
jgi:hypothetical protein